MEIELFADTQNKLIRCMGDYEKHFPTNPILMLKAVTLCAEYGFEIEENTKRIIKKYAVFIKGTRGDLLLEELNKILLSPHPDSIRILHETLLLRFIIPPLNRCFGEPQRNKYHIYDVGEHIMHAVKYTRYDPVLRWAALLHDIGKPVTSSTDENGIIHFYGHHKESKTLAEGVLRRLRMDSELIRDILILIENHDVRIEPNAPSVKRMLSKTGPNLFLKLLELQTADNYAKNAEYFESKRKKIEDVRDIYYNVISSGEPYSINHLMINSRDLQKIGFKKGRIITDILKSLLGEVISSPNLNNRDYLIKKARQMKNKKL